MNTTVPEAREKCHWQVEQDWEKPHETQNVSYSSITWAVDLLFPNATFWESQSTFASTTPPATSSQDINPWNHGGGDGLLGDVVPMSYVIKMADGDRNSVGNGRDCDICVVYQPTDYRLGGRCWKASGIVELAWDESPWDVELSWENPPAGQQQNIQPWPLWQGTDLTKLAYLSVPSLYRSSFI